MAPSAIAPPDQGIDAWSLAEAQRLLARKLADTHIKAWLFGSRARGDHRPFSDIDIALQAPDGAIPREHLAALREAFEESCIPYRVDLVDLAQADEHLLDAVRSEGIPWRV